MIFNVNMDSIMTNKFQIQTLNNISAKGLKQLPRENYDIAAELTHPDAIILRSHKIHDLEFPETLKAVGRAGAGVNNIPIDKLTELGIPVFNTPGANANAVKELVIGAMLLASRNICQAWNYVQNLTESDAQLNTAVEQGKKQFVGFELTGKTLGVIGLGAIGVRIANAGLALGMNVIGYDPVITVKQAWELERGVKQAKTLDQLLSNSDFVTLHVPLNSETKNMVDSHRLATMRDGAVLINFARGGIVDEAAVLECLQQEKLNTYVTDFPNNALKNHPKVISLPHLGASTKQSEENCATMIAQQIRDFLENGNINHSVNFPEINMPWNEGFRVAIVNKNIPNMVGQISTTLAKHDLNVIDLINKSRDNVAYTLVDVNTELNGSILDEIRAIEGVISVRTLN